MKMTQSAFAAYVRNPSRMPAYSSKVLSDQDLGDIWAYVKSLPESKPATSIPLIQQIASQN
jgi:mono/diheme cytochrome c family protein